MLYTVDDLLILKLSYSAHHFPSECENKSVGYSPPSCLALFITDHTTNTNNLVLYYCYTCLSVCQSVRLSLCLYVSVSLTILLSACRQCYNVFTARCTLVQSAVLRSHVVCPSVRLSVTLMDQDHIGRKSWKLIARTLSPTPSLFGAKRSYTYSQGNMGKFRGD